MKKIIGVLLGTMVATIPAQAQIIINEVMQSNIDCLVDDSNEFPDSWVELYNPQGTSENLNRYKIGLSADISSAYQKVHHKAPSSDTLPMEPSQQLKVWLTNLLSR